MRPKSDSERQFEAARDHLKCAEKDVRAAEKITSGHPAKIEAKRRRLRDLRRTMAYADDTQNNRANRGAKEADLESDLATLEQELRQAQSQLRVSRDTAQDARMKVNQTSAQFSNERDRALVEAAEERAALARKSHELAERKFAQAEQDKVRAAQAQLDQAELDGKTAVEIERYRAKVQAATLQFEWKQRQEMAAFENEHALTLTELQGAIASEHAEQHHTHALETIKANELADLNRIAENGRQHRLNVTHETNEEIRKAIETMALATQKGMTDTLNAAKLLVLQHYLKKDELSHAQKIASQGSAADIASLAGDMADIERFNEAGAPQGERPKPQNPQSDFENDPD